MVGERLLLEPMLLVVIGRLMFLGLFANGFKYLKVVSERLEARDLDGPTYWLSPSISIADYVNIAISIAATELGSMEVDDVIESEYRIDGGAWTTFASNGSLGVHFAAVYQDGLSGNTLEIRVKMQNNSSMNTLELMI